MEQVRRRKKQNTGFMRIRYKPLPYRRYGEKVRQIMTIQRQTMLTERQIKHLERETEKIRERKQREIEAVPDYGTTTTTQADTYFNIYK